MGDEDMKPLIGSVIGYRLGKRDRRASRRLSSSHHFCVTLAISPPFLLAWSSQRRGHLFCGLRKRRYLYAPELPSLLACRFLSLIIAQHQGVLRMRVSQQKT
ncbi:unnamed protein product [Musa acuminata subsp. burmannicoides]